MAALNAGQPVNQVVRFKAYDLLVATNRGTDGRGYEQLRSAFNRLQGTQIETNILTGGTEALDIFSLIDRVRIMRETREGRMQEVEVRLSDRSEEHTSELQSIMRISYAVFRLKETREQYEVNSTL